MTPSADLQKVEEIIDLLRKGRLLLATTTGPVNDLDSLLSVAESEARRIHASILYEGMKPEGVPVLMSQPTPSDEKRKRR
jgi:hypothetical protein